MIYDISKFNPLSLFSFFLRKYCINGRELYVLFRKLIREIPIFKIRYGHPYFVHVMVFNKYCEEQGFNMEGQELYERWYTFLYEETNIDDKEKHHIKHTYLNLK